MATNRDYYEILGINKTASADEIKKAYRAMALKFHPDRNKERNANENFKEINQAYEILSNPDKRATYDQFGHAAFEQGNMGQGSPYGPGGASSYQNGPFTYTYSNFGQDQGAPFDFGGFSDPFDIFEQFFGGSARQARRQSRKTYSLSISFMEAVKGIEKEVDINGKQTVIKIPAGVDSNSRIRFNDFDIILEVSEDKVFKREDQNIFVDLPLSISQAVLGTVASVPTIDGPVSLKIQQGTQTGSLIRLKGRGVKNIHGSDRGDEYVKIQITIPTKLSREQKTLFEQLEKSALR